MSSEPEESWSHLPESGTEGVSESCVPSIAGEEGGDQGRCQLEGEGGNSNNGFTKDCPSTSK